MKSNDNTKLPHYVTATSEYRVLTGIEKAVKFKEEGCCTFREAAANTCVSKSSIQRAVKAKAQGRDMGKRGRPSMLNEAEKSDFIDVVKGKLQLGEEINCPRAIELAKEIWVRHNQEHLARGMPKFNKSFVRNALASADIRIPFVRPRIVEEEGILPLEILQEFFDKYENIVAEYDIDLRLIWNTDEIQSRVLEDHRRLVCAKNTNSSQPVKQDCPEEEDKTIVLFVNAAGEKVRPTIIFPLETVPPLNSSLLRKFDIELTGSDNGCSRLRAVIENRFMQYLDNMRREEQLLDRWALLILDNHSSRLSLADEEFFAQKKLKLLFIPPHLSALIQPLDLGPNLILKEEYSKWYDPQGNDDGKDRRNRQIDSLGKAISMATCEAVVADAWRRAGMWPINFEVIANSKMVKPSVQPILHAKQKRGPKTTDLNVLVEGATLVNDFAEEIENASSNQASSSDASKKRRIGGK